VRLRQLSVALVAAAVAVVGLSACTTKVGAAAIVGGHRISEREVDRYLLPGGATPSTVAAATAAGSEAAPKYGAVNYLISQELFTQVLKATGGVPTPGVLASYHDAAVTNILQSQSTGTAFDSGVDAQAKPDGYSTRFRPLLINSAELEWAIAVRVKATSITDVAAAVAKQHISVQVSGQYGKWDPSTLQLGATSTGIPSFIKVPKATASSSAAPTG
jgi:hypothetical protein